MIAFASAAAGQPGRIGVHTDAIWMDYDLRLSIPAALIHPLRTSQSTLNGPRVLGLLLPSLTRIIDPDSRMPAKVCTSGETA